MTLISDEAVRAKARELFERWYAESGATCPERFDDLPERLPSEFRAWMRLAHDWLSQRVAQSSEMSEGDRSMLRDAAAEIRGLRRRNEILDAKVCGFELACRLFDRCPANDGLMRMDIRDGAWQIERRLDSMKAPVDDRPKNPVPRNPVETNDRKMPAEGTA